MANLGDGSKTRESQKNAQAEKDNGIQPDPNSVHPDNCLEEDRVIQKEQEQATSRVRDRISGAASSRSSFIIVSIIATTTG